MFCRLDVGGREGGRLVPLSFLVDIHACDTHDLHRSSLSRFQLHDVSGLT